ncbi:unnamed protein product [Adineta steineri]|uniref:SnoaL-like domain-containing protein n=1 Tax=Adineta steineri TaxID=433720 RepID=A0A815D3R5_9BILA|nr:unnamed protein product [Adineta steineri]
MSVSNVLTTEQNEVERGWIQAFYNTLNVDSFDIERWFEKYFENDASVTYNNDPPYKGYNDVSAHILQLRQKLSVKYTVKHVDVISDRIYVEIDATVIRKNDPEKKEIHLSELAVFYKKINENKISSLKIYVDPTPLLEKNKT